MTNKTKILTTRVNDVSEALVTLALWLCGLSAVLHYLASVT